MSNKARSMMRANMKMQIKKAIENGEEDAQVYARASIAEALALREAEGCNEWRLASMHDMLDAELDEVTAEVLAEVMDECATRADREAAGRAFMMWSERMMLSYMKSRTKEVSDNDNFQ